MYRSCLLLRFNHGFLLMLCGNHVTGVSGPLIEAPRKLGLLIERAQRAPESALGRLGLSAQQDVIGEGVANVASELQDVGLSRFPHRAAAVRAYEGRERSLGRMLQRESLPALEGITLHAGDC